MSPKRERWKKGRVGARSRIGGLGKSACHSRGRRWCLEGLAPGRGRRNSLKRLECTWWCILKEGKHLAFSPFGQFMEGTKWTIVEPATLLSDKRKLWRSLPDAAAARGSELPSSARGLGLCQGEAKSPGGPAGGDGSGGLGGRLLRDPNGAIGSKAAQ